VKEGKGDFSPTLSPMSPSLYSLLRPLIYLLSPEQAHSVTLSLLRLGGSSAPSRWLLRGVFAPAHPGPAVHAFGLDFANPIGLAAGYDKDGLGWRGLACLGFGHLELGTVTPRPQPGNPSPRVFRLVADRAVINRMGFPGRGAAFIARRLVGRRTAGLVVGVNIGKNKDTTLEQAAADYVSLFHTLAPLADYLAINVSSPNTPGLRTLQTRQALEGLLAPLSAARAGLAARTARRVPLLVKLAPDLTDPELDGALEAILACGMDGVIQGNTTLSRPALASPQSAETGGLSGLPLQSLALAALRRTVARLNGRLPVIASGGVMDPAGARARLDAGAALVQLYTGLIYQGPALVRDILNTI
jgi:dihydroorotate dehydrogenase